MCGTTSPAAAVPPAFSVWEKVRRQRFLVGGGHVNVQLIHGSAQCFLSVRTTARKYQQHPARNKKCKPDLRNVALSELPLRAALPSPKERTGEGAVHAGLRVPNLRTPGKGSALHRHRQPARQNVTVAAAVRRASGVGADRVRAGFRLNPRPFRSSRQDLLDPLVA